MLAPTPWQPGQVCDLGLANQMPAPGFPPVRTGVTWPSAPSSSQSSALPGVKAQIASTRILPWSKWHQNLGPGEKASPGGTSRVQWCLFPGLSHDIVSLPRLFPCCELDCGPSLQAPGTLPKLHPPGCPAIFDSLRPPQIKAFQEAPVLTKAAQVIFYCLYPRAPAGSPPLRTLTPSPRAFAPPVASARNSLPLNKILAKRMK